VATPTYPTSLPAPLINNYGYEQILSNVSVTPDSFGFQTQKRISEQRTTSMVLSFVFNEFQMNTFEMFYFNDLINGHKWFKIDILVGAGYIEHYVQMTSKYEAKLMSNTLWSVSFNIEIDNKQLISQLQYINLTAYDTYADFNLSVDYLYAYSNGVSSDFTDSKLQDSFIKDKWV